MVNPTLYRWIEARHGGVRCIESLAGICRVVDSSSVRTHRDGSEHDDNRRDGDAQEKQGIDTDAHRIIGLDVPRMVSP